jgi:hypothetical protein
MSSDNVKELAGKLTHAEAEQTAIRVGIEALTERVDKKSSSQYSIELLTKFYFFENLFYLAVDHDTIVQATQSIQLDVNKFAEDDDDIVDPWNVTSKSDSGINYDKLIGIK